MNIYNKLIYMLTIFLHTSLISFSSQGAQLLRHYSNRRSLSPKYLYNNIGKGPRLTRATFSTHLVGQYPKTYRHYYWLSCRTLTSSFWRRKTAEDIDDSFLKAAQNGDVRKLTKALAKGASLYTTDQNDNNALHLAAAFAPEGKGIVWLLDTDEFDIEAKNKHQKTPFLCAAAQGNLPALKILQEEGAQVEAVDESGNNALHLAIIFFSKDQVIEWLINTAKIAIEAQGQYQRTPFLFAAEKGNGTALKLLWQKVAQVHAIDQDGNNALHLAALYSPEGKGIGCLLDTCNLPIDTKNKYGSTPFLCAAEKGNFTALKLLWQKGAQVDATDQNGNNALHLAALHAPEGKGIGWLLHTCNLPVEAKNNNGATPFLCAAKTGNLPALKMLKTKGANLNATDQDGENALHYAALYAPEGQGIEWLIDTANINIESKGNYQKTAFLFAAEKGNLSALKILQKKGANLNATDQDGDNAFHYAALYAPEGQSIEWLTDRTKLRIESKNKWEETPFLCAAQNNLPALKLLREKWANVKKKDKKGSNALHYAAAYAPEGKVIEWLIDVVKIDIESQGYYEATPFLFAAEAGNLPALKLLKAKGADINATSQNGNNALHYAALVSEGKVIAWLIDTAEINIESKGNHQKTAFLFAAEKGNLSALKVLQKKGANLNVTSQDGNNALHYAALYAPKGKGIAWLIDTAEINIESKGNDQKTAFLCVAENGNLSALKILQKKGANVNATCQYGNNALHYAALYAPEGKGIGWLIDTAHLSTEIKNNNSKTAFLCAAENGNLSALKILQKKGANLNATDQDGNNALHLAALHAPEGKGIPWLIDTAKINIESKRNDQRTTFLCAAKKGNLSALKILKEKGANINAKDQNGKNALALAKEYSADHATIDWLEKELNVKKKQNIFSFFRK